MDRIYEGAGSEGLMRGGGGVMMTRDSKPRLRWTADLHDRFVDAVTKLGGPDSESILILIQLFNNVFVDEANLFVDRKIIRNMA